MDKKQYLQEIANIKDPIRLKEYLESRTIKILREIHPPRATLRLLEGEIVSKDYLDCSATYYHTLGRWLLWREEHIYEKLRGIAGVMQETYLPSPYVFCMEYLQGYEDLKKVKSLPRSVLEQLRHLLEGIHSRGVIHFDIGHDSNGDYGRETNLVWNGDKLYLIDFASSICGIPKFMDHIFLVADYLAITKVINRFFPGEEYELPIEISEFDRKILKKLGKL